MAPRSPKKPVEDAAGATVPEATAIRTRNVLKKKDFVDRAIERSGLKKTDAKAAVEATLAVLADALRAGDELVLPPLGKIKVAREKAHPRGKVLMIRLQLAAPDEPEFSGGTEPLAEAVE